MANQRALEMEDESDEEEAEASKPNRAPEEDHVI